MSSILGLVPSRKYHLYRKETDMRKSFDSLAGIITNELGKEVAEGEVFIFVNRARTHLKLLLYEQGGFSLFYRRLSKGTFELPAFDHDCRSMAISSDVLEFILKGITLKSVKYRVRHDPGQMAVAYN
ncbi:IS66 family insertion sequence element accessory protein TnpB [Flavivirga sp. 57AJ16]|uniref:IS66 family insertion sequence element accessory protein TnpB n=1 Tax=Flavivirga sp. 57AJ16 TaxID=3025307 RepID=UPI002365793C|nr:IS66 family insertion sequence element accessory protein TnpB [Flavivirga sp. 57AJ16]MDD7888324.1 IS66 family insertion sequence element accessory protein TnpB [Flavivirga sp. 57AJ16]